LVLAKSFTGLKNWLTYDRYTVEAPTVITPARMR